MAAVSRPAEHGSGCRDVRQRGGAGPGILRAVTVALAFVLVLAPPEAPASAPTELSEGTAAPAPAEPEIQRPAGAPAPVATPAAAATPTPAATPTAAPVATSTTAPVRRVNRPKPGADDIVAPAGPQAPSDGQARYYRAPFSETVWPKVVGRDVLLVMGTQGRTCVTLHRKTNDALHYTHRKSGAQQQAPLAAVTSIHENSWECDKNYDSTPSEWARSGAIGGIVLSSIGAIIGVMHDADTQTCTTDEMGTTCSKKLVPHFAYTVVGVTTTTLGTPIIAAGGYSTSRDLRVKGKIWAKATGWAMYGAGTLLNVLWIVGNYGKVDALDGQGMTAAAGLLGLGGSAFMAVDALAARRELAELRKEDATPNVQGKPAATLQFGARPVGAFGQMSGLTFGLGGRF